MTIKFFIDEGHKLVDNTGTWILTPRSGDKKVDGEIEFKWIFCAAVDTDYIPPNTGLFTANGKFWLFCAKQYYTSVYVPNKNIDEAVKEQKEIISQIKPDIKEIIEEQNSDKDSVSATFPKTSSDLLKECEDVNNYVIGWLTIEKTNIDYPIVQYEDNDFYLHHGVDGSYNYELGCPFMDCRCESDWSGFNSIIYAHNMSENRMFADIAKFRDKEYFDDHKLGYLILQDSVIQVDFFSYLTVPSNSPVYNTFFITSQDHNDYIKLLYAMAEYTDRFTEEELQQKDNLHFLLLSTCTFEYDDARGVLVGLF